MWLWSVVGAGGGGELGNRQSVIGMLGAWLGRAMVGMQK